MILHFKSIHSDRIELISGRVSTSFGASFCVPLRKVLGAAVSCVLVALLVAGAAFAQSEPSAQSPSPSSVGQEAGTTTVIPQPTQAPPEYLVGPGDVLGITVYNMSELDRTTVVGSNGALQLSYIPQPLKVNGETAQQIGKEVASELKRLQVLIDPQVGVTVLQVESKPVVVGGDVGSPHVLQEIRPFTLLEALMLAGGPRSGAGDSVLVTRTNSKGELVSFDLQLSKVMSGTDPSANIGIKPGDTIQVLPGEKVFVAGAVKTPGAFDLGRGQNLSVSKVMALTGGWKADAVPGKAVIVRQGANGQRKTVPVNLPKIMARKEHDVRLEPNDLLYVPSSTARKVGVTAIKGVGAALFLGAGYLIIHR